MQSTEKVQAEIARAYEIAQAPTFPAEAKALLLMLEAFGGAEALVDRALPKDPAQLDELLLKGAHWALSLRSDSVDDQSHEFPLEDADDEPSEPAQ